MDLIQFHKMRTAVQGNSFPGSGAELETVGGSLKTMLMDSGLFEQVEVEATDNPDHLVIAMCTYVPDVSEDDVALQLERIWHDRLRYPFWEAHAFRVEDGHVEFEAASRAGMDAHYVTVHLIAQKAQIPAQRTGGV